MTGNVRIDWLNPQNPLGIVLSGFILLGLILLGLSVLRIISGTGRVANVGEVVSRLVAGVNSRSCVGIQDDQCLLIGVVSKRDGETRQVQP